MIPLTTTQLRGLVGILVLAGLVRLVWALYATMDPISPVVTGDPWFYFQYGKDLAAGEGYVNAVTGQTTAYYPIGYPAILAVVFWVVQHTPIPDDLPMAASLFQVTLGTASVGLVFVIARHLFDARSALVAAGIVAVFPNLVFYVATMALETTFIAFALAAVAVLVTHDWSSGLPSRLRLLAFGAVLGSSALVRPFSFPFLVGLLVAGLAAGLGWRRSLAATGWSLLAVVVVVSPWVARNQVVLGAPVFTTNMGDTVCIDRYVGSTGAFRFLGQGSCERVSNGTVDDSSSDFEVRSNNEGIRGALDFVVDHPDEEVRLVFTRARLMFRSDSDGLKAVEGGDANPFLGDRLRTVLRGSADWFFRIACGLGLVGSVALVRRRRPDRLFTLVVALTLLLVPLVLWGNPRFHLPLLPFVAILAAVPLAELWRRARTPRPRPAPTG